MSKHKTIPKNKRIEVYNKYGGHCAYCGCEITMKEMQVDHKEPIYPHETAYTTGNADWLDDLKNLMPACRMCNFYKSTKHIEQFRKDIETIHNRLEKTFIYRLGKKYGIIEEHGKEIVFCFEKFNEIL